MDNKVSKPNFFSNPTLAQKPKPEAVRTPAPKPAAPTVQKRNARLNLMLDDLTALLLKYDMKALAESAAKLKKEQERAFFTVAVAGEFSKGKSTFINKLLGRDFLPTGNLPTTAMLTKIRYNPKEMIVVYDENLRRRQALPLLEESWDGLTADFSGNDPKGVALVGINSPWLRSAGIEIEDTPGAGDLDEERVKITGEALQSDDGAIITVSATSPLSMSERVFIEQRLITPKTPYLMLIITKLDQIPAAQRAGIVEYIKSKLKSWNRDIPVFIPYKTEFPDNRYDDIIGLDKIRAQLERWTRDPQRARLADIRFCDRIRTILSSALSITDSRLELLRADKEKRRELIRRHREKLSDASVIWNELRTEMTIRCDKCYSGLMELTAQNQKKVIERLQYEVSHNSNPQVWWKEDYPYRLKVEVMGISSSAESYLARTIGEDMRWLNRTMNERFKTHICASPVEAGDSQPADDSLFAAEDIKLKDLNRQRAAARIGTATITAIGYALAMVAGVAPIFASLGISTGSSLVSENVFKAKIENQQKTLKEAIERNVPEVIKQATADSRKRLSDKYSEILKLAKEQEESWMRAQLEAIEQSDGDSAPDAEEKLTAMRNDFETVQKRFGGLKQSNTVI